jgi:hypothetical protein
MGKLIWGTAFAALATLAPAAAAVNAPVGVTVGKNGVGVTSNNRPVVGVSVGGGDICIGVSYELPFCLPPTAVHVK